MISSFHPDFVRYKLPFSEASMLAGIPISVPSNTITQACISSNQCLTTGAEKILSGQADIIIAGISICNDVTHAL